MTCFECQRLTSMNPEKCTVAEVSAVVLHMRNCVQCSKAFNDQYDRDTEAIAKVLTPQEAALLEAEGVAIGLKVIAKVMNDPEGARPVGWKDI